MAIDYERLKARVIPDVVQELRPRDIILYALGIGLGADPLDEAQLRFVYEDGLRMLPTMPVVLAAPGFWAKEPDTGIDWVKLLHGEQGLVIHRPLPTTGTLVGRTTVDEIIDKGPGKGALMFSTRKIFDQATGELVATSTSTSFMRGDGGFGGPAGPTPQPHAIPDRAADQVVEIATAPNAALIYRLSGDYNPLHIDPAVGKAAGFRQPILHGLCSFGVAGHALLKGLCGYEPDRLKAMQVRFTSPVYPGETLRTEIWQDGAIASFRTTVVERGVVALNNGRAEIA
ncbi:MaoC/PaaZ C-terminal domain-containing protein [Zavarzinia sp. CC-PAN008]|uniref:MaoC family dehydratase n=1 Tax=Zavarzinia sp. CC-PAN008 TaxID=3243332 RepID=UPI003F74832E